MVDFSKMRSKPMGPRMKYLFRCGKCNEEHWYITKLPPHLRNGHRKDTHPGIGTKCWGTLIFVKEEPDIP